MRLSSRPHYMYCLSVSSVCLSLQYAYGLLTRKQQWYRKSKIGMNVVRAGTADGVKIVSYKGEINSTVTGMLGSRVSL